MIPGRYTVDQLKVSTSNISLHFERDPKQPPSRETDVLHSPDIILYERANAFNVEMSASKHIHLNQNNLLDMRLDPGWNEVISCELRVKPATGGLRLLTTEAKLVDSTVEFSKSADAVFSFGSIPAGSSVLVRFPYSIEQDNVSSILVRHEITYTTKAGDFVFCKTVSIPISLALGVNVQDIFKHKALFSRFNVSTASASPLRLFKSELGGSDVYEASFGVAPRRPIIVFPKQPASLLYKITRRDGVQLQPKIRKTLSLKLHYSVVQDEIETVIESSLKAALARASLEDYSRVVVSNVLEQARNNMSPSGLERAALLGEFSTGFLANMAWESRFGGLGQRPSGKEELATVLASFLRGWQKSHTTLAITEPDNLADQRSITIPVDVPSVPVVHTVDIQLQHPVESPYPASVSSTPVVSTNQLLPAVLHLQWSQVWNTSVSTPHENLDFTYEVTAPADTWLLGGRRRGHFTVSSKPSDTKIPLLLVPLREGWLPYPVVDIRRAVDEGSVMANCEVDHRNLGETVRVVADREKVTLSLDASGPGGGPLVLESERRASRGRAVA